VLAFNNVNLETFITKNNNNNNKSIIQQFMVVSSWHSNC